MILVFPPGSCVLLAARALRLHSLAAKGRRHVCCFSCSARSGRRETASGTQELKVGKCLTHWCAVGTSELSSRELHVMTHPFFCSCIFLSRKMNRCYSNQVSSCAEIWQTGGNDLESCAGHCAHLARTWERSMDSPVGFLESCFALGVL